MTQHALCVLTYVPRDADRLVLSRLPLALASLEASSYDGLISIIDDGSTHPEHVALLDSLTARYHVVRRPENGGICRAKNTCLRVLKEREIRIGFIAEDDIEFAPGWYQHYLAAHQAIPTLHHLSWAWDQDPSGRMRKSPVRLNGFSLVRTSRLNGLLLTLTPKVLDVVGGFRILPGNWGHTHTNWTRRIVQAGLAPFYVDVVNSNQYVRCGTASVASPLSAAQKRAAERLNRAEAFDLNPIYCPLEE